ncbi:MAG: DNA-protecting protein DprA [Cellulosilyticum sp.]|nr:DNA-protecting protein DprA [Cellulosilyticum sp.]
MMSKIYDIWFHKLKLSIYVKKLLLEKVNTFQEMYQVKPQLYRIWGLSEQAILLIEKSKQQLDEYKRILLECRQEQIEVVGYFDETYPKLLKEIPDPPMVIYIKGNKEYLSMPAIGIVGARKCTEYGDRIARRLGEELADYGITVVSGMAMGIDAAGHQGALKQNGATIAVLGTGVNVCYPECNRRLYNELLDNGCVVSEYEPFVKGRPYHFPRRNRIISGLCYGIVIVEAAQRSGSLITAQLALDYNREVYAVPGYESSRMSQGANELIAHGAKCIFSVKDIIEELPKGLGIKNEIIKKNSDKMHNQLALAERIVYAYVSQEPILLEKLKELLESTQLSYERLNTSLLQLEVKGLIKRLPGERYVRI